jgi:hypothetical protein
MTKAILQFKSVFQLWQFKQAIAALDVAVNLSSCTLTCWCEEAQIRLALETYGATLVRRKEVNMG